MNYLREQQRFFRRSDSTTVLGCEPPEPLHTALCESLPLAEKPHLLNRNARREELFGAVQESSFAEGQRGYHSSVLGLNSCPISQNTEAINDDTTNQSKLNCPLKGVCVQKAVYSLEVIFDECPTLIIPSILSLSSYKFKILFMTQVLEFCIYL